MKRDAVFSNDREYRYLLTREWDETLPRCIFVGLNPSRAGAIEDDLTATKYVGFASRLSCGSYDAGNIHARVGTDPLQAFEHFSSADLRENSDMVDMYLRERSYRYVICAWGDGPSQHQLRVQVATLHMLRTLGNRCATLHAFGLTKRGNPLHVSRLGYAAAQNLTVFLFKGAPQ